MKKEQDKHSESVAKQNTQTDDRRLLQDDVVRLFHSHFSEVLDILSARFPHIKDDGSQNEIEYAGLRAKVLRSGNNKLRQLPSLMADFNITKTHETIVETVQVNTPVVTSRETE